MRVAVVALVAGCGRLAFEPTNDAALDAAAPNAVVEVSAGGLNTCARLGSGDVYCWGRGDVGGIGDGSLAHRRTPARVPVSVPIESIYVNDAGACVLAGDGTMRCWGRNHVGQLGAGFQGTAAMPVASLATDIAAISLGNQVACIIRQSGQVACAGQALLVGSVVGSNAVTFTDVPGMTSVRSLINGDDFTCALRPDGSVACWGFNLAGAFGDNTQTSSITPVDGPAGPYTLLAAGDQHTCGLREDGTVDCWGRNVTGELGDGTFTSRSVAAPVLGITDATYISAGASGTCALHSDRTVSCWGRGPDGELGDGTIADRAVPGRVPITDVIELETHTSVHTCVRRRDASVWCWGDNEFGQIGNGTVGPDALTPQLVVFP